MKIILKELVPKLGQPGDVREVAAGFARNYLIPRGLGVLYSASAVKQWETEKQGSQKKLDRLKETASKRATALDNLTLTIKARAGEGGKLFGSITKHHVAHALADQGAVVEKHEIELEQPLKELGQFPVIVKLHPDVSAKVTISIVTE